MPEAGAEDTGVDQRSRFRQWLDAARDDFEREAPEVLEGMAADARKFARFLDEKASKVRGKQATEGALPEPGGQSTSGSPPSDESSTTG